VLASEQYFCWLTRFKKISRCAAGRSEIQAAFDKGSNQSRTAVSGIMAQAFQRQFRPLGICGSSASALPLRSLAERQVLLKRCSRDLYTFHALFCCRRRRDSILRREHRLCSKHQAISSCRPYWMCPHTTGLGVLPATRTNTSGQNWTNWTGSHVPAVPVKLQSPASVEFLVLATFRPTLLTLRVCNDIACNIRY
jgi:hypothetical protein